MSVAVLESPATASEVTSGNSSCPYAPCSRGSIEMRSEVGLCGRDDKVLLSAIGRVIVQARFASGIKISSPDSVTGRPLRMRSDQSCPQDGQVNHAMMPDLFGSAGTSGRPQWGHAVVNVAPGLGIRVMPDALATAVPTRSRE